MKSTEEPPDRKLHYVPFNLSGLLQVVATLSAEEQAAVVRSCTRLHPTETASAHPGPIPPRLLPWRISFNDPHVVFSANNKFVAEAITPELAARIVAAVNAQQTQEVNEFGLPRWHHENPVSIVNQRAWKGFKADYPLVNQDGFSFQMGFFAGWDERAKTPVSAGGPSEEQNSIPDPVCSQCGHYMQLAPRTGTFVYCPECGEQQPVPAHWLSGSLRPSPAEPEAPDPQKPAENQAFMDTSKTSAILEKHPANADEVTRTVEAETKETIVPQSSPCWHPRARLDVQFQITWCADCGAILYNLPGAQWLRPWVQMEMIRAQQKTSRTAADYLDRGYGALYESYLRARSEWAEERKRLEAQVYAPLHWSNCYPETSDCDLVCDGCGATLLDEDEPHTWKQCAEETKRNWDMGERMLSDQVGQAESRAEKAERDHGQACTELDAERRKVGLLLQPTPGGTEVDAAWKLFQHWLANRDAEKHADRERAEKAERERDKYLLESQQLYEAFRPQNICNPREARQHVENLRWAAGELDKIKAGLVE